MSAWWDTYGQPDGVGSSSPTASVDQRAPSDTDVDGFHSYRRPEHLTGERLDHRSDIFSIGAVIYEMATGQRAFPGDTPSRIAAAIVSGHARPSAGGRAASPASSRSSITRWRRTRRTGTRAPRTCSRICAARAGKVESAGSGTTPGGAAAAMAAARRGRGRC